MDNKKDIEESIISTIKAISSIEKLEKEPWSL